MMAQPHYARRLGTFSATMIVVGGIIGAGIFLSPAEVARRVAHPTLILAAWLLGGVIALIGAVCFASRHPRRIPSLSPETRRAGLRP